MNIYGADASTYGIPVLLIDYTVPLNVAYKLATLIGWGDTPAEFELAINDEVCGGCRDSDQVRTVQVWWDGSIILNGGDTVSVMATHYSQGSRMLKCNLILNRI